MVRKAYTPEQIIANYGSRSSHQSRGHHCGSQQKGRSYGTDLLRWRREYGGMRIDRARRLKELEKENNRLKKLVAELSLDISILKQAAGGHHG